MAIHTTGSSFIARQAKLDRQIGIAIAGNTVQRATSSTTNDADTPLAVSHNSDKQKILFLSHYFPPEGNAPASRVHEMCKRWVRDGHEVTVITCAPNCPTGIVYKGYRNKLYSVDHVDGIRVVRVWTFIAANKGKIRRSLNFLSFMITATLAAMIQRRPDVLVATSPQFFCGWAGTIVSKIRRLPFLLEIRDIWPESIAAVGAVKKRGLIRILETMEQLMYRSATHIVTVGDGYRTQLARRGVDKDRISVVTNGVDREIFDVQNVASDAESVRERHHLAGRFVVSYIGTIGMASALSVVIRAAKILKDKGRWDINFMLVGDGATKDKLQHEAKLEGVDNIIFTGRLDKLLMPAYLSASDACLVHLKKQELFKSVLPSKMFEAAAMGKPILLGVQGCAADYLRDADAGIAFEPENEHQLVEAIEQLAANRDQAHRFGQSARNYVLKNYDRDQLSRDYITVIAKTRELAAHTHEEIEAAAALS